MMSESTQRWRLTIAYDGRTFDGWQSQPSNNTVQDHVERALAKITKVSEIRIHGSGRTDAGVHAEGQVAHFDAPVGLRLGAENWPMALNTQLPPQIRVMNSEPVGDDFHARFSATGKTYTYRLAVGNILSPMSYGRIWMTHSRLDSTILRKAAEQLEGRHDFQCFAANGGSRCLPPKSTIRTIARIECHEMPDNHWELTFSGDGFLYKMVRMLVGTMVGLAAGRISESTFQQLVLAQPGLKTPACAPADGLYLVTVRYA
jgi:tRNA pseudouridine38-40 synthase